LNFLIFKTIYIMITGILIGAGLALLSLVGYCYLNAVSISTTGFDLDGKFRDDIVVPKETVEEQKDVDTESTK